MAIKIQLEDITSGEVDKVSADMRKFNKAKQNVAIVADALKPFLKIESAEAANEAMENLKVAASVSKAIEAKRKALVGPYNEEVKRINEFAKSLTTDLEGMINGVKTGILSYQEAEKKRLQEEKAAERIKILVEYGFEFKDAAQVYEREGVGLMTVFELKHLTDADFVNRASIFYEKIQQLNAPAPADELDAVFASETVPAATATAPPPPVLKTAPAASAVKGTTTKWVFEVTDATLVPRQYLVVDETAIRKAVAAGERNIPGVNIHQDQSITIR